MTQTRLTPIAVMSGNPNPSVRRGTMRIPPPSPRSEPNRPAATPPPMSRRTISTSARSSAGWRRLSSALVGRASDQRRGCRLLGAEMLRRVRQEGDDPGSLEGDRELALVGCARPRLAAGLDLRPLRQVAPEPVHFLVVDPLG